MESAATLASVLDAVTVHAQGAICTRHVQLPAGTGRQLRVGGLPLSLQPGSLRAWIKSGPAGLSVHDVRPAFEAELPAEVDLPAEQRAVEESEEQLSRLTTELERVRQELAHVAGLRPIYPTPRKGDPPRAAPVGSILALADFVDEELAALHARRLELERAHQDARERLELHRRRRAEASSAHRTERARLSRVAVIQLAGPEVTAEALLVVEYLVPGARWSPSYELRLAPTMASGLLRMRAAIVQHTGEDWKNVRLRLSTADLDRRTELPELRSLRIGRAQPPPPRSGWRQPPLGLDSLFGGYDDALQRRTPEPARPTNLPVPQLPATLAQFGGAVPVGSAAKVATDALNARPKPGRGGAPKEQERRSRNAPRDAEDEDEPTEGGLARRQAVPDMAAAPPPPPSAAAPMATMAMALRAPAPMKKMKSRRMAREESDAPMEDLALDEAFDGEYAKTSGGGGGGGHPEPARPEGLTLDTVLLDYHRLVLQGPDQGPSRGRLQPATDAELLIAASATVQVGVVIAIATARQGQAQQVGSLSLPPMGIPVRDSAGSFDYAYDADHRVDVESDGAWHTVAIGAADVALAPEYVCVPSVEPKVFRSLTVVNRSSHALLAGPVDVTLGDAFLLTVPLPTIAPRGEERIGLGVEEGIQVVRNTRYREGTSGLLNSSSSLVHELELQASNQLTHPALLEIRERVPIATHADIKVDEVAVKPPWKPDPKPRDGVVAEGARVWRLSLAAGEKASLSAQYVIKVPADSVLVGGNRRV